MSIRKRLRQRLTEAGFLEPGGAWSISIFEGSSPTRLDPMAGTPVPVLTHRQVSDVRASFVADPFMLHRGETWHLFFEVMNADLERGQIAHATSRDLRSWTYGGLVLALDYHLSYPFVFEHEGDIYMIPETAADRSVQLLRAATFPHQWEHVSTLLRGYPFVDATLHQHDGHWYLFVDTDHRSRHSLLRLFHAGQLTGPWVEHPSSPIRAGESGARPGGRLVTNQGNLLRFSQVCNPRYGTALEAIAIQELSPSTYRELGPATSVLAAAGHGWNGLGMHHVDPHELESGRWVASVDGRASRRLTSPFSMSRP
jgi:beta-xylosidase